MLPSREDAGVFTAVLQRAIPTLFVLWSIGISLTVYHGLFYSVPGLVLRSIAAYFVKHRRLPCTVPSFILRHTPVYFEEHSKLSFRSAASCFYFFVSALAVFFFAVADDFLPVLFGFAGVVAAFALWLADVFLATLAVVFFAVFFVEAEAPSCCSRSFSAAASIFSILA